MTVYIMSQIKIHDRETYNKYEANFMGVFEQFNGTLLSVDESPLQLGGEYDATRVVLISFPDAKSAKSWMLSDAYKEIAKDRLASSTMMSSLMVQGLEDS